MQNDLFSEHEHTVLSEKGSVVRYQSSFFTSQEADTLLQALLTGLSFKHEAIKLFGKTVMQPRLTAWYADTGVEYTYAGLRSKACVWTPHLQRIKVRVEEAVQHHFNGVLCNYYRNGDDYMGWHRDNEASLGEQPVIASISLGAERRFDLRRTNAQQVRSIMLAHGSLLVMSGTCQQYWQHRLPKDRACDKGRINLTFRCIKR